MVKLSPQTLRQWILALPEVFEANLERLNTLDAKAGDGDHGTTILRGVKAAAEAVRELQEGSAKSVLSAAGSALRRSAGGASGPLFSSLFLELAKTASEEGLEFPHFITGLTNTIASVSRMGKAQPGDRTMLDALAPALKAAQHQADLSGALLAVVEGALKGVESTATMTARKGRAQFVNAGQVGSPDAGATSVVLMLQTLQEVALEKTHQ
jgi:phosphoenolpyruvate---glycerone phosphotransferase subunit DhaL